MRSAHLRLLGVALLLMSWAAPPALIDHSSPMTAMSDTKGFVLVTPQGRGPIAHWDFRSVIDSRGSDLGFVRGLVAKARSQDCIDSSRMYATGFSNGSALTFALACDGLIPFAAYRAVSAPFFVKHPRRTPPQP